MSPKNAELTKLFDESITHWERMIAWAEKQPGNQNINYVAMARGIRETWFGEYCILCAFFNKNAKCLGCPLENRDDGCCSGLWYEVATSSNWGEWIERAKDVLAYIKEKRDEEDH